MRSENDEEGKMMKFLSPNEVWKVELVVMLWFLEQSVSQSRIYVHSFQDLDEFGYQKTADSSLTHSSGGRLKLYVPSS